MALKGPTHWDSPAEGPSRGTAHHTRTPHTRASRAELRAPASHLWASLSGKESACSVGDLGSIPGLGRCPGEGKGYPLQYSGLENSMPCIVHRAAKSWIQLIDFHFQMPAGVLTGAGGDHPPLPSFFPPKPKSCLQPTPSDVPLCHAPACCIFFEFQVLVFAPPHLASGIRHVRSLFPCSSRAQGLPQR